MKNFLFLFTFIFLIAACKVESSVSVNVEDDGTGSVEVLVELDDEASRLIGDIEKQLRTEDLDSSGWEVSLPESFEEKSKIVVSAAKNFTDAASLVNVLEEIAGPSVFSEISLSSEKSFAKKLWTIDGKIDLSEGLSLFSDPALDEVLGGNLFGRSIEDLSFLSGCDEICDPAGSFLMNFSVLDPGYSLLLLAFMDDVETKKLTFDMICSIFEFHPCSIKGFVFK